MMNYDKVASILIYPHESVDQLVNDLTQLSIFLEDDEPVGEKGAKDKNNEQQQQGKDIAANTGEPEPKDSDKDIPSTTKDDVEDDNEDKNDISTNDIDFDQNEQPPEGVEPQENPELLKQKSIYAANLDQLSKTLELINKLIIKYNDHDLLRLRYMVQKVLQGALNSSQNILDDVNKLKDVNNTMTEFINRTVDELEAVVKKLGDVKNSAGSDKIDTGLNQQ